uniref:(northern house mosquito) hypothetical protein n=1 Tax=Culex pipiens TaxID=7175 RepID=A0A8D8F2Y0_CULPI
MQDERPRADMSARAGTARGQVEDAQLAGPQEGHRPERRARSGIDDGRRVRLGPVLLPSGRVHRRRQEAAAPVKDLHRATAGAVHAGLSLPGQQLPVRDPPVKLNRCQHRRVLLIRRSGRLLL